MLFNAWTEVLEEARRASRRSQEKAAEMAGVSTATWYRWESGSIHPGAHQLEPMARGVGLDVRELALRYAHALIQHYGRRSDQAPRSDVPAAPAGGRVGQAEALAAQQPIHVRGISEELGAVWVDVREVVDAVLMVRASEVRGPRRWDREPAAGPETGSGQPPPSRAEPGR